MGHIAVCADHWELPQQITSDMRGSEEGAWFKYSARSWFNSLKTGEEEMSWRSSALARNDEYLSATSLLSWEFVAHFKKKKILRANLILGKAHRLIFLWRLSPREDLDDRHIAGCLVWVFWTLFIHLLPLFVLHPSFHQRCLNFLLI